MPRLFPSVLPLALLAALAACDDGRGPVAADASRAIPGTLVAELQCEANAVSGRVVCRERQPAGAGSRIIISGPNGTNIQLTSSNLTSYADTFAFDVTVLHRIVQSLGTTDGTTAHASGVRVFFSEEPYVTSPVDENQLAAVSVGNEDGWAVFENSVSAAYFQYAGLLPHNTTSAARTWKFHLSNVNTFAFGVKVWGEVKYPNGWTVLTPSNPAVAVGWDDDIRAVPRNAYGVVVGDSFAWTSSNPSVATVSSIARDYGRVVGVSTGTAWVKAVSTTSPTIHRDSVLVQVLP